MSVGTSGITHSSGCILQRLWEVKTEFKCLAIQKEWKKCLFSYTRGGDRVSVVGSLCLPLTDELYPEDSHKFYFCFRSFGNKLIPVGTLVCSNTLRVQLPLCFGFIEEGKGESMMAHPNVLFHYKFFSQVWQTTVLASGQLLKLSVWDFRLYLRKKKELLHHSLLNQVVNSSKVTETGS